MLLTGDRGASDAAIAQVAACCPQLEELRVYSRLPRAGEAAPPPVDSGKPPGSYPAGPWVPLSDTAIEYLAKVAATLTRRSRTFHTLCALALAHTRSCCDQITRFSTCLRAHLACWCVSPGLPQAQEAHAAGV